MKLPETRALFCALGLAALVGSPAVAAQVETKGFLKMEGWFPPLRDAQFEGTDVFLLTSDPNYAANTPDFVSYAAGMNTRPVFPDDTHDQYGARLTGWVTPLVTGDYNFYLASDDASELWISTDQSEANLVLEAQELTCCHGFVEPGNLQTTLAPLHMEAGQKYAIQILLKEGAGADFVQVAMQEASGTIPAADLAPVAGSVISSMADPAGGTLTITQQPVNSSTPENTPVAFAIAANADTPYLQYTAGGVPQVGGTPPLGDSTQIAPFYQWFTNGVAVPGANSTTFTVASPKKGMSGMKVKCYVAVPGIPLDSNEATLTVTDDTTAPTVLSATADTTFSSVVVKFSEPVSDSALATARYTLDQGPTVASVTRLSDSSVKLATSRLAEGAHYTLSVAGVQDTATPPNSVAANTQAQFTTFVFAQGAILHQKYDNVPNDVGASPNNLFDDPRFPNNPDRRELMARWEYPPDGQGRIPADPGQLYFDTLDGYFIPPTTGNYVFYTAGADRWWLYLSTDEDPANKKLIAAQPNGWTNPRNWLTGQGPTDVSMHRSDTYTGTEWENGNTISLQAGRRYYMLMVHHDPSHAGADDFAATFRLQGEPDPANGEAPLLTGNVVGSYLDASIGSVTFSSQPASAQTLQGTTLTFTSAASGTSLYGTNIFYRWQTAPKSTSTWADIPGATSASYTTGFLTPADDGRQFRVVASAPPINATSTVATVTISSDLLPPTVAAIQSDVSFNTVFVTFSEPVSDSALQASRYTIDQGVTVTAVQRISPTVVRLTTSTLGENKVYNVTVNGVQDTAVPPNTIAADTKAALPTLVFMPGTVLHQKYDDVDLGAGSSPAGLFNDARYNKNPDRQDLLEAFEYPANGVGRDSVADPDQEYFDSIEGYFIPPSTGNYVFYTAGADRFWLYLSTDENPANKKLIAAQPDGWTSPRYWLTGQGETDVTRHRSDTYVDTQWPDGATISLEAGQRYYMELIHYDPYWAGGDYFAATYKLENEADPLDGEAPKLTGNVIGYYIDPSGTSVTFDNQPVNVTSVEGLTATLSAKVSVISPYGNSAFYQWQTAPKGSSTWTDIPGATSATYNTPFLNLTQDGTQYRVIASAPPVSKISDPVTVTVLPDTFPPVVSVGAMQNETGGVDIGIGFDEPVTEATGNLLANYTVSSGTITSISWQTNRFTGNSQNPAAAIPKQTALLKVTGLTGSSGTLTVRNVSDTHGNAITTTNVPFTVDMRMKWGVVGANEFGGWNAVVPVALNGWDLYSDGTTAWNNYDEATLLYEEITGDFDKKVRVAYQDGSSQWARAGLIAKESTDIGVDRATQATSASRYQKCFVTPVGATLSGPGTGGAQEWELNRRLEVGGVTAGPTFVGANAVPKYPNAWCRLQRTGQTFNMYRSDDGVNWVLLASTTWGVDDAAKSPMPAKLYVGLDYSPEVGNITLPEDRGTFLAQFRDYADVANVVNPQLAISKDATGKVTITWTSGTLVSSPTAQGTYTPVAGAASPYVVTPAATTFYRVQQ